MKASTKLAQALKEEFERLKDHPNFDGSVVNYDLAIKYLETGNYPSNYDDYDMLSACIEDFEQMYNDYVGD